MKTLKEYEDYLLGRGYKLEDIPYNLFCGDLTHVGYEKNGKTVTLGVEATEEFREYLDSLQEDTEYEIKGENYNVKFAIIHSDIVNIANFMTGSKQGITLVREPDRYYKHDLSLFKYALSLQEEMDLVSHTAKIMEAHARNLKEINKNLIPILKESDYTINYHSIFNITDENRKDTSDFMMVLKHYNGDEFYIETDCLTGNLKLTGDIEIWGKTREEIWTQLKEKIWEEDSLRYSYLWEDTEDKNTFREILGLMQAIRDKNKSYIPKNIPPKYEYLMEQYEALQ